MYSLDQVIIAHVRCSKQNEINLVVHAEAKRWQEPERKIDTRSDRNCANRCEVAIECAIVEIGRKVHPVSTTMNPNVCKFSSHVELEKRTIGAYFPHSK